MRALGIFIVLFGLLIVLLVVLPADAVAKQQAAAEQAAAQAAAAEASVALAHAAEIKAHAEAQMLAAQAEAYAAGASATVQERMTHLALEAGLRARMNDLRVFGVGALLGTLAGGLPALFALVLLRLLLGAEWRQQLFGRRAALPGPVQPPAAPPEPRNAGTPGATVAPEARHRRLRT